MDPKFKFPPGQEENASLAERLETALGRLNLEPTAMPHQDQTNIQHSHSSCDIDRSAASLINVLTDGPKKDDDTVIFLQPPPQTPDQSKELYDTIVRRYRWPLFGRSEVFKQYAPEFYETYFSVTYQPRYRRRFASRLRQHPEWNIRFILDVTPAIEGDEAIQSVTRLQCPTGVLIWHRSISRFGCREELVNGPLDLESDDNVQAYSQVRHNLAIERLLLALHGHNPQFDTAIKVYSTAMLSKQFNVTSGPLQDWVVSWLSAANNSVFTEVLPEATLAMADSLQVGFLAVEAFAILLGEACLEADGNAKTVHNRLRYEIDDGWRSRIQYARQSFETRVQNAFKTLTDKSMTWIEDTLEFQKLLRAKDAAIACDSLQVWDTIVENLKDMVRDIINYCLHSDLARIPARIFNTDESRAGNALYGSVGYRSAWSTLPPSKRIFTRLFWFMMTRIRLGHFGDSGYDSDYDVADIASNHDFYFLPSRIGWFFSDFGSFGQIDRGLCQLRAAISNMIEMGIDPVSLRFRSDLAGVGGQQHVDEAMLRSVLVDLHAFSFHGFFKQVEQKLVQRAQPMLQMPVGGTTRATELQVTNVLLCLTEEELRYLPLWAGGNDDGTGGVFEIDVPQAVDGFSSHGPFIHRENDSCTVSEYSYVSRSTDIPSSCEVNDGFSDTLDRRRVYASSEVESDVSWTDVLAHRDQELSDNADEVVSVPETAINHGDRSDSPTDLSDYDLTGEDFESLDAPPVSGGRIMIYESHDIRP